MTAAASMRPHLRSVSHYQPRDWRNVRRLAEDRALATGKGLLVNFENGSGATSVLRLTTAAISLSIG